MQRDSLYRRAARVPFLFTRRLYLCRVTEQDARGMYDYARQARTTKYLLWSPHKSLRYTKQYIRLLSEKYESCEFYDWGVHDRETGAFIGTCGFASLDDTRNSAELGYVFSPRVWGRGYATEAARCVMDYGFRVLKLDFITARFLYGNTKSEAVMRRLNMTSQGVLPESLYVKGRLRTVLQYRITKEEYFEKNKKPC